MTGRNYRTVVKLTKEELNKLEKKASEKNMKVAEYLRIIGLNTTIEIRTFLIK